MVRWAGKRERGQATVELAVALPVAIIVAVIAVNALMFFSLCASFDRVARQAICVWVAVPAAGEGAEEGVARVRDELRQAVGAPNVAVDARAERTGANLTRVTARIEYRPTLFGLGIREEVLGVALPPLTHEIALTVDAYRPGILF